MTATLSSSISSLIAADTKLNEMLMRQSEENSKLKENLETIQHPKIKKFILQTLHSSAQKSIHGPSNSNNNDAVYAAGLKFDQAQLQQLQHQFQQNRKLTETSNFDSDNWSAPPPNSLIKGSMSLAAADDESFEKCETLLHGERITCFIVGGEKRLCLPQILNYVLKDFSCNEINHVCEKLHIYCSRCSKEQLNALILNNILPPNAQSCGLITLSDAERLCHKLMSSFISKHKKSSMMLNDDQQENRVQLKIYHCCFGRAYGIVHPHLYTHPNAQCVECETCHLLFAPQHFVVHTHRNDESRICHWGFDSNNWRLYIKLVESCKEDNKYKQEFESFKMKFSNKRKSMNDDATNGYALKNSSSDLHTSTGSIFKKLLKTSDLINNDNSDAHKSSIDNSSSHQSHHLMNSEHKLLNDLLSKPINNANAALYGSSNNNSAITMFPAANATLLNSKVLSSLYSGRSESEVHSKKMKYMDDYPVKGTEDVSKYDSNTAIEILFDNLQNEIDGHVKTSESRDRLANYLMRIKAAYNENLIKFVKNRLELQESRHNIELENEILKSRIKYLELDNQFLRTQLSKPQQQQQSSSSSSSSSSSQALGQSPYLRYYQQQNYQSEKLNENETTATANDASSSLETTSSSAINNNETMNVDSAAGSPQQQAAAIALISLHSPPAMTTSTPKKPSTLSPSSKSSNSSVSPTFSNVNQILANTFNIKVEQTTQ